MPIPSNELTCKSHNTRTARYGIETATFSDSRTWSYLPSELKEDTLLNKFRLKTKTWKPENLSCKLCKIYLQRIGYLQVTICAARYCCYQCFLVCLFVCFAEGGFLLVLFLFLFYFLLFPLILSSKLT